MFLFFLGFIVGAIVILMGLFALTMGVINDADEEMMKEEM